MFDFNIDYTDTGAEPPPLFTSPSKLVSCQGQASVRLDKEELFHHVPRLPYTSASFETASIPVEIPNPRQSLTHNKTSQQSAAVPKVVGSLAKKGQTHNHTRPRSAPGSDKSRAVIVRRTHRRRTEAELLAVEWDELPWIKQRYTAGSGQMFRLVDTPNVRRIKTAIFSSIRAIFMNLAE